MNENVEFVFEGSDWTESKKQMVAGKFVKSFNEFCSQNAKLSDMERFSQLADWFFEKSDELHLKEFNAKNKTVTIMFKN